MNATEALAATDVDAMDPAFAPGSGTPEPGGMTSTDLLWACREVAARSRLVGADIVEVLPTQIGAADITALVGSRLAHEILTGLGLRRRAHDRAHGGVPASGAAVVGGAASRRPAESGRC